MREYILQHSLQFIEENKGKLSEEEKEKILYGMEGLYITVTKLFVILLLAFFLGIIKEFLFVLLFFNIVRFFGFGFHANNSITCFIASSLFIVGIPYLLITFPPNLIVKISLSVVAFLSFLIYAPADTEKRPLTNQKKRRIRKIVASSLALIYIILIFGLCH